MVACNPTRRTMLAGIAAAPIAAGIPALALAAPAADAAAFDHAYDTMTRAWATCNHFDEAIYKPAWRASEAEIARLPHLQVPYDTMDGGVAYLSTDNHRHVESARHWAEKLRKMTAESRAYVIDEGRGYMAAMRKVRAHWLRRQRHVDRIHKAHGMTALCPESDRLGDVASAALCVMIATPTVTFRQIHEGESDRVLQG